MINQTCQSYERGEFQGVEMAHILPRRRKPAAMMEEMDVGGLVYS
jgi:hypothetical protein